MSIYVSKGLVKHGAFIAHVDGITSKYTFRSIGIASSYSASPQNIFRQLRKIRDNKAQRQHRCSGFVSVDQSCELFSRLSAGLANKIGGCGKNWPLFKRCMVPIIQRSTAKDSCVLTLKNTCRKVPLRGSFFR